MLSHVGKDRLTVMELARTFRQRAAARELMLGTLLVELRAFGVPAVLQGSGFDFFVVDQEHGCYSDAEAAELVQAGIRHGLFPMVRVAVPDHERITHALDSGAQGLLIPMATSLEYVEAAVAQSKYPPHGHRSPHFLRPHTAFDVPRDQAGYMAQADRDVIIAIQIETVEAAELMDEIAAMDGVDMLYLGPSDLSASMGLAGQPDHPRIGEVIHRIIAVCRKHHKIPAGHLRPDIAVKAMAAGMNVIGYAAGIQVLKDGATRHVDALREQLRRTENRP